MSEYNIFYLFKFIIFSFNYEINKLIFQIHNLNLRCQYHATDYMLQIYNYHIN